MASRDRSRRIVIPPSKEAALTLYGAAGRVALISGGVCFSGYILQDVFDKVAQPIPLIFKVGYVGLTTMGLAFSGSLALNGHASNNLTTIIDGNLQTITRKLGDAGKERYVCRYDSIDDVLVHQLNDNLGIIQIVGSIGGESGRKLLTTPAENPYELRNKIISL